ncbi:MAG: LysR family transcriptional regulator [Eubacteriales bacterium]|nr:LysR family transcriptional regulator [Eubacteriales bacterium]
MKAKIKLVIENEERFFGPGVAELLSLIDKYGSIQAACSDMNMSYSKAWKMIKRANEALGFSLLASKNGGKEGGESRLTEEGRQFLRCYKDMKERLCIEADRMFRECFEAYLGDHIV